MLRPADAAESDESCPQLLSRRCAWAVFFLLLEDELSIWELEDAELLPEPERSSSELESSLDFCEEDEDE